MANDLASNPERKNTVLADAPTRRDPRRRRKRSISSRQQHRRIRFSYFGLASIAGFVIGSGAVIGGQWLSDPAFRPRPVMALVLLGSASVAVVAGVLVARLYRRALGRSGLKTPPARRPPTAEA